MEKDLAGLRELREAAAAAGGGAAGGGNPLQQGPMHHIMPATASSPDTHSEPPFVE